MLFVEVHCVVQTLKNTYMVFFTSQRKWIKLKVNMFYDLVLLRTFFFHNSSHGK